MSDGGRGLVPGRHDFASFCENAGGAGVDGRRSRFAARSWTRSSELHYRIEASHFLWKMVRRIVGTLVEVGRGNLTAAVADLLRAGLPATAEWTAPPSGLFLEEVAYPLAGRGGRFVEARRRERCARRSALIAPSASAEARPRP